jgi:RHS repeat-associated protein
VKSVVKILNFSSPISRWRNQTHNTKMKHKLTFALVAALTSTAFAEFKAPLPEFKNEKQLAEWRAEKASESTSQGYATEATAFYTGKPYLASSGGYAFKYRNYIPELSRWTSEDPSGFPDGVNNQVYVPAPSYMFDPNGLEWVTYNQGFGRSFKTVTIVVTETDTQFSLTGIEVGFTASGDGPAGGINFVFGLSTTVTEISRNSNTNLENSYNGDPPVGSGWQKSGDFLVLSETSSTSRIQNNTPSEPVPGNRARG